MFARRESRWYCQNMRLLFSILLYGLTLSGCAGDSPDDESKEENTPEEVDGAGGTEDPADTMATCDERLAEGTRDFCLSSEVIARFWESGGAGGAGQDVCPPPEEIPHLVKVEAGAVGDVCGQVIHEVCDEPHWTDAGCCYAVVYGHSQGCDT